MALARGAKLPRMQARKTEKMGYMLGIVVAKRQPKTLRVAVDRRIRDTKYGVWRTRRTLFMVHDELEECVYGDVVIIKVVVFPFPLTTIAK
jgi:ribosomal protein S17